MQFLEEPGRNFVRPRSFTVFGLRFNSFSVPVTVIEISGVCLIFLGFSPSNQSFSSARIFKERTLGLEKQIQTVCLILWLVG